MVGPDKDAMTAHVRLKGQEAIDIKRYAADKGLAIATALRMLALTQLSRVREAETAEQQERLQHKRMFSQQIKGD